MLKHQLLEILKTLTDFEKKKFGKFLSSPYFTNSPKILKLYRILKKFHPNYNSPKLNKHNIHRKLDYGLPYNDSTIRNLIYDLQEYAERYLKQQNFDYKPIKGFIYSRQEFINRGLHDLYEINVDNTDLRLEKSPYFDTDYAMDKFLLEDDKFHYSFLNNKPIANAIPEKLNDGLVSILVYFTAQSIKNVEYLVSYTRKYGIKKQDAFIADFVKVVDFEKLNSFVKKYSSQNVMIDTYLCLLKAFVNFDNENYYNDFKKALIKNADKLSEDDKNYLFMRLKYYCTMKGFQSKKSKINFEKELFEIYDLTLKKGYYKTNTNPYLPLDLFKDILQQGLKLKKYPWTESFISENKNKLRPENRKDMYLYSMALLNFDKSHIENSLNYLKKINNVQFIYNLEVHDMMLRILIDSKQYEKAINLIDNYKESIWHDEITPEDKKDYHSNFVSYANKLIKHKLSGNHVDLKAIAKDIEMSNVLNKQWLIDKFVKPAKR
jgi:hypothetical protein